MAVSEISAGSRRPGMAATARTVTVADRVSGGVPSSASRPRRRRGAMILFTGLVLAGAVVFGLVLVNIVLAQRSFELGDLQSRVAEQQTLAKRLRYEIARAESPERIAQAAAAMGLVSPEREEHIQGPAVLVSARVEPKADIAGYELSTATP